jgi:hypothetical protein
MEKLAQKWVIPEKIHTPPTEVVWMFSGMTQSMLPQFV